MELIKELESIITEAKISDGFDPEAPCISGFLISSFKVISELCEGAGVNQWDVKDQIDLAIEQLKD